MRVIRTAAVMALLAVSACSSGSSGMRVADNSCAGWGFRPGSAQYDECIENLNIRKAVTDHSMVTPTHTPDPLSVSQQYQHTVGAVVNCTSYTMPGAATVCG